MSGSYKIVNTVSNDKEDWRYRGQAEYLDHKVLLWMSFTARDHDHCEFCMARFGYGETDLRKGYCTKDQYYWICEDCYNDFKHMFDWKVDISCNI